MLKRPLLLKLFALFLLIDPVLRVAFIAIEREFSFLEVLNKTLSLPPLDIFNFWLLFPISGILLLGIKSWSYIVFISIQLYSFYFHINYEPFSWPYLSKTPSATAYLLLMINFLMVLYLLLPRTREVFFNKELRWWERGARYTINEPCFCSLIDKEIHGKVVDLSHGGALLTLDSEINKGDIVDLDFEILNQKVQITSQVIRRVLKNDKVYYGTQFKFSGFYQKLKLKFLMLSISKISNYEKYR